MVTKTRKCPDCKKVYLLTAQYFYRRTDRPDFLHYACKECHKERSKRCYHKYRRKNLINQQEYHKTRAYKKSREKYNKGIRGVLCNRFNSFKDRCNNSKNPSYGRYGGRGIKCKFKSGKEFADYVINELKIDPRGLYIDRIDNDGHYEHGNIRFVTAKISANNRRNSKDSVQ